MTGFNSKREAAAAKLDNDDLTIAYMSGYHDGKRATQPAQSVAGYCKKIEELIAERDNLRAALAQQAIEQALKEKNT